MKYLIIFFIAFFSLAFLDTDPPQCIDGVGHLRHRYLYSLRDTTGLVYSFDTTTGVIDTGTNIPMLDTVDYEWLVIPAGWDTLVWQRARCDSIQYEPSDTIRQISRIIPEIK